MTLWGDTKSGSKEVPSMPVNNKYQMFEGLAETPASSARRTRVLLEERGESFGRRF